MIDSNSRYSGAKDSMRILLLYVWGNANAGDKALALGTIGSLRQCFPSAMIHVVSIYSKENDELEVSRKYIMERYPDVDVIQDDLGTPRGRQRSRVIRLFRKMLTGVGLLCPLVLRVACRKSAVFAALRQADVVLLNGGHLLFWSQRMGQKRRIMEKYLLPLMVARRLGRPYGLHAQSYGPFEFSRRDCLFRWVFRYVLTSAGYLSVRERASLAHLETCISNTDHVKRVLDSAFFLTGRDHSGAAQILQRHHLAPKGFLAVTLRLSKRGSQKNLPPELYKSYAQKIGEFVSLWTRNEPLRIMFVSQVPKDVEDTTFIVSRLSDAARKKCVILEHIASPELLIALYANAAAVLGMRFHSLIFALAANTPVMGLYYYDIGPKIKGIMEDVGYPEYAFSLERIDGLRLYQSASKLLANTKAISEALADRVESLRQGSLRALTDRLTARCKVSHSNRQPQADIGVCSYGHRAQHMEANRCAARNDAGVR